MNDRRKQLIGLPGHWEGDDHRLGQIGDRHSGERTTRFTMLLHLPRMEGHGTVPRVKNGLRLPVMGLKRFGCHRPGDQGPASAASPLAVGTREQRWPGMRICGSQPAFPSTSANRTALGNAERTRTPMDCFDSERDLSAHSRTRMLTRIHGPARPSDGAPKLWTVLAASQRTCCDANPPCFGASALRISHGSGCSSCRITRATSRPANPEQRIAMDFASKGFADRARSTR